MQYALLAASEFFNTLACKRIEIRVRSTVLFTERFQNSEVSRLLNLGPGLRGLAQRRLWRRRSEGCRIEIKLCPQRIVSQGTCLLPVAAMTAFLTAVSIERTSSPEVPMV